MKIETQSGRYTTVGERDSISGEINTNLSRGYIGHGRLNGSGRSIWTIINKENTEEV